METSEFSIKSLPEWYRIEREAQKSINKLTGIRELDLYLKNPDEYIRRLAILRLLKFSPKDSVFALKDLFDDPLESEANKHLAAWVLKALSVKHNYDIYLNNRYLSGYTGTESFDELFGAPEEDEIPPIRFDFSQSPSRQAFSLDSSEAARAAAGFNTDVKFNYKKWLASIVTGFAKSLTAILGFMLLKLPLKLAKALLTALKQVVLTLSKKRTHKVKAAKRNSSKSVNDKPSWTARSEGDNYSVYREMYKRPGASVSIKKGLFNMLYFLFFPVRFALKHKLIVLFFLASLYVAFAFTDYGRAFTNKYAGIDLQEVQQKVFERAKSLSAYALDEFNKLTGIDEWKSSGETKTSDPVLTASADIKRFTVTAQEGLNIRSKPDSASEKVGESPLPYGTTVTYLLKSQNDTAGRTWYLVESGDGRTGWVSAKFLKEKGDEGKNG